MRKTLKLFLAMLLSLTVIAYQPTAVKAEGAYVDLSGSSVVTAGDAITITVSIYAGQWDISLLMDGSVVERNYDLTNGEGNIYSSINYTLRPSDDDVGKTYVFSLKGDYADFDDASKSLSASGYLQVTVVAREEPKEPEKPKPEEPKPPVHEEPEEEEKSSDARLLALDVDKGVLTPQFSASVTDYEVTLPSTETEITISAVAWDDNAEVYGAGLKSLKVGSNSFTIDVYAEDGTRRAYTVNVNVEEEPEIELPFNDKKMGILEEVSDADVPKGFKPTTININDQEVKAFTNSNKKITLLYLKDLDDENANPGFYLYSEAKGVYSLYRPIVIEGKEYFVLDIPEAKQTREKMQFSTITVKSEKVEDDATLKVISKEVTASTTKVPLVFDKEKVETEDISVVGWKFEDTELSQYALLYLLNSSGQDEYYLYDSTENTLKVYPKTNPVTAKDVDAWLNEDSGKPWLLYGGIGAALVVLIIVIAYVMTKNKKAKKQRQEKNDNRDLLIKEEFFDTIPDEDDGEGEVVDEVAKIMASKIQEVAEEDDGSVEMPTEVHDSKEDDDWLDDRMINAVMNDEE